MSVSVLRARRVRRLTAGAAMVITVAAGGTAFADDGGGEQLPADAPPGLPDVAGTPNLTNAAGLPTAITTGGSSYDPTVLTKFIGARGFVLNQGATASADLAVYNFPACIVPDAASGGTITQLSAAVELPDGARIKQLAFYGEDNDAGTNITVDLHRGAFNVPIAIGPSPTRSFETVTSFTTAGVSGVAAVTSADNLGEVTGSFSESVSSGVDHRFHTVEVTLANAALAGHVFCGVEVRYQVPVSAEPAGVVFHPIAPVRAYDSRLAAYTPNGPLAPNSSRVIDVSAAHDSAGAVTAANVVPAGATAITYNITVAGPTGPNFVAVTPGDAVSFTASTVNFNGSSDLANAATVAVAGDRTIKVWGGDQSGSTHVIIDVTGYYAPAPPLPNMAG